MNNTEKWFDILTWRSEEIKSNANVDNIGAVASGGVGDSVGAVVIFLYLQISILILLLFHAKSSKQRNTHKGLSIYYVIRDGGGLPNLLQYYIGGFFKVYYNITDLVGILKGFDHFQYYICFYVVLKVRVLSQIWKKIENMRF